MITEQGGQGRLRRTSCGAASSQGPAGACFSTFIHTAEWHGFVQLWPHLECCMEHTWVQGGQWPKWQPWSSRFLWWHSGGLLQRNEGKSSSNVQSEFITSSAGTLLTDTTWSNAEHECVSDDRTARESPCHHSCSSQRRLQGTGSRGHGDKPTHICAGHTWGYAHKLSRKGDIECHSTVKKNTLYIIFILVLKKLWVKVRIPYLAITRVTATIFSSFTFCFT